MPMSLSIRALTARFVASEAKEASMTAWDFPLASRALANIPPERVAAENTRTVARGRAPWAYSPFPKRERTGQARAELPRAMGT